MTGVAVRTRAEIASLPPEYRRAWELAKRKGWVREPPLEDDVIDFVAAAVAQARAKYPVEHDMRLAVEEWAGLLFEAARSVYVATPRRGAGPDLRQEFRPDAYGKALRRIAVLAVSALAAHRAAPSDPRQYPLFDA